MAIRSNEEWQKLFAELAESGETPAAFCARHKIRLAYFYTRRRELTGQLFSRSPASSAFVRIAEPASPPLSPGSITLTRGTVSLTLPAAIAPQWVADLVRALGS